jgi:hypothetical protein
MSRMRTPPFLAVFLLAAIAVQASDFWVSKDWKQWSKDDCEKLLSDSPWAHIWRRGDAAGDQFVFSVQLRSALPIRQAIVRQLQIQQKYDKLDEAKRSEFDAKANQILNRSYDNAILVHVEFYKGLLGPVLLGDLKRLPKELDEMDVTLVTNDQSRIKANRVDLSKTEAAFGAVFPRSSADGAPALKEGQAHFWVQFVRPAALGIDQRTYPGGPVEIEFDLTKMIADGKLMY